MNILKDVFSSIVQDFQDATILEISIYIAIGGALSFVFMETILALAERAAQ